MRGKYIQYNSIKKDFYSPEEATSQKINNIVCSQIVRNVYKELLNITTPEITKNYIEYAHGYNRNTNPEVVAYTPSLNNKATEIIFNFPNLKENKTNPTYKDIVHHLQPGDILVYYNIKNKREPGHTMMVLDVNKNKQDALILESTDKNLTIINTKFAKFPLFFGKINNTFGNFPKEEGSLRIKSLSKIDKWKNMNQQYYYTIIRFIQTDEKGYAYLSYDSQYQSTDFFIDREKINLFPKERDRIKFSHLYIEKTVDKHNNNIVEIGDYLTYKIIIKNAGESNYNEDLIVTEQLDKNVEYINSTKKNEYFEQNRTLIWNIGKLQKGNETIIEYCVKIKGGILGEIISNVGKVGNIPSSTVKNIIGKNLNNYEQIRIKKIYEKLKSEYTYVNLINAVYKESFNVDIGLNEFNFENLINNNETYNLTAFPRIIESNNLSKIILNNHYSALALQEDVYYKMKHFREYKDPERRQDFIYPDLFKTGDILIYSNYRDEKTTNESGEYAYIYIDNYFVGNNPGRDGKLNKRNNFTAQYYNNPSKLLLGNYSKIDEKMLEIANLQTLLAKDYYVILRPSLYFNFTKQCEAGKYLNQENLCQLCPIGSISSKGENKCKECQAGSQEIENRTKCMKCLPGTFSKEGSSSCEKCPKGYYSKEGSSNCTKCPFGSYSSEGADKCDKCFVGFYLSNGKCQVCPTGTYSLPGAINCTLCPAGTHSILATYYCDKCEAGYYSKEGSTLCTKCKAGYYSEKGASECIKCPIGYYSLEGASKCEKCPDGQYLSNGKCFDCEPGTYSKSGAIKCTECEAGTFSEIKKASSCNKCNAGYYSKEGASKCEKCTKDYYSKEGASECLKCPIGSYSSEGADKCKVCLGSHYFSNGKCLACEPGTFSLPGAIICTVCPAGTYSLLASDSCKKCQAGYYSKERSGQCTQCQAGYFSKEGSAKCIKCKAGTYSNIASGSCIKCLPGFYSDIGASSCKKCKAGTYSGEGSSKCYQCPGGFYSPSEGANICKMCPANKYSTPGSRSCQSCPRGKTSEPGSSKCS